MSVFSSDLQELQRQTNTLRENLKTVTGIDCSGYSIGNCAGVALQKTNTDYVEPDNDETDDYIRPDWYPDIKSILNSAPEIIKDDVTYYPIYIMLMMDTEVSSPFYTSNSTSSSAVNYYRGTGGNAYIFSDVVDNNIANANADTLEVGATITHTWDLDKDIADPTNEDKYKVRWVVVYKTSRTTGTLFYCFGDCPCIEIITGDMTWHCGTSAKTSAMYNSTSTSYTADTLKYVEIGEDTKFTQDYMGYGFCSYVETLEKVVFNCQPIQIYNAYFLYYCYNLKKIDIKNKILSFYSDTNNNSLAGLYNLKEFEFGDNFIGKTLPSNIFQNAYNLKSIVIPSGVQNIGDNFCSGCSNLTSIVLPSSLIQIGSNFCSGCRKLENISLPNQLNSVDTSFLANSNIKSITIPNTLNNINSSFLMDVYNLKYIYLQDGLTILNWNTFCRNASIDYLKIPNSLTQIDDANFNNVIYIKYLELYDDFDISDWRLSNSYFTVDCLKNICIWLKDKTGETANTMILGEQNINNLSNIYCVYDSETKQITGRIDSGTDAAISGLEYITTVKNWTIS